MGECRAGELYLNKVVFGGKKNKAQEHHCLCDPDWVTQFPLRLSFLTPNMGSDNTDLKGL